MKASYLILIWDTNRTPLLRARVTKEYSTFPKPSRLKPHHQMHLSVNSMTLLEAGSYHSAEMQSAYSTAPTDWVLYVHVFIDSFYRKTLAQLMFVDNINKSNYTQKRWLNLFWWQGDGKWNYSSFYQFSLFHKNQLNQYIWFFWIHLFIY